MSEYDTFFCATCESSFRSDTGECLICMLREVAKQRQDNLAAERAAGRRDALLAVTGIIDKMLPEVSADNPACIALDYLKNRIKGLP